MKNLNWMLHGLWAVLLVLLFVLHFTTYPPAQATALQPGKEAASMVYVNTDTLLQHYQYFKDIKAELEGKRTRFENDIAGRAKQLEQEMLALRQQAATMTEQQQQQAAQQFQQKQEALVQYRDNQGQVLAQEEQNRNAELFKEIADYLAQHNPQHRVNYVFGYAKGGNILYASDSLDITTDVIKGLNSAYVLRKAKK